MAYLQPRNWFIRNSKERSPNISHGEAHNLHAKRRPIGANPKGHFNLQLQKCWEGWLLLFISPVPSLHPHPPSLPLAMLAFVMHNCPLTDSHWYGPGCRAGEKNQLHHAFQFNLSWPTLARSAFFIDVMAIPLPSINVNVSLAAQRFLFPKHIVGLYSWVNIAA